METLYDLLGALPRDDAEELRVAFRRAVKGTHPDLNPGDPLAAEKFREIVRANEILTDEDQRAAYDHLLDLARKERKQQRTAKAVHKLATSVIALVAVAGLGFAGYVAVQQESELSPTLKHLAEIATARPSDFAGLTPPAQAKAQPIATPETKVEAPPPDTRVQTASAEPPPTVKQETASVPSDVLVPVAVTPPAGPDTAPPAAVGPPLELASSDAHTYRERGIFAYRSGDLDGAIADFDRAIQLDPRFSAAYIDRGIVLYRLQRFERAFADIAHAKRIEKTNRTKTAQTAAKKPNAPQAAVAFGFPPFFHRRTAKLD